MIFRTIVRQEQGCKADSFHQPDNWDQASGDNWFKLTLEIHFLSLNIIFNVPYKLEVKSIVK